MNIVRNEDKESTLEAAIRRPIHSTPTFTEGAVVVVAYSQRKTGKPSAVEVQVVGG